MPRHRPALFARRPDPCAPTSDSSEPNVSGVQGEAVAVMIQRLFQLTFACRDVASDVGRGGVLSVDFSSVDVNEGGLHVPVVERQKSRFRQWTGRCPSPSAGLGSAIHRPFRARPTCAGFGPIQPRDVEFSVKRQGAVERRKRSLQKRSSVTCPVEDGQHGRDEGALRRCEEGRDRFRRASKESSADASSTRCWIKHRLAMRARSSPL